MGRYLWAAVAAGIFAGTLDIFVACAISQTTPDVIGHFLAAGVLGRDAAFHGGVPTMALGFAIQEFISIVAAGLFIAAATRIPALFDHAILSGIAYGAACNLFLAFVVQPLSLVARTHPITQWTPLLENLAANMVLYGPPMVLIARRILKR
jgi:hypothetical protein